MTTLQSPANFATTIDTKKWMENMPTLDDMPLREIVIPGSHDAGTYEMYRTADNNSSQCQEITIYEQLNAGSRYLDLRAWLAKDDKYWMYHTVWTNVKLETVLSDILRFLNENTSEIVIATLEIDSKSNQDSGWNWACSQVAAQMATRSDLNGKKFSEATPSELRKLGKRLILLRHSSPEQFANIDREGVYGNSLYPENYRKDLEKYPIWTDKMWILHLGIPYSGEIHNDMPTRASWNAKEFIPYFLGQKMSPNLLERRLNIINVDFIQRFQWVPAIVGLNLHRPKSNTNLMMPQIAISNLTWHLEAFEKNGHLWLTWNTTAPFRAQQGRIQVFKSGKGFPIDPSDDVAAQCWDNEHYDAHQKKHLWDTGLKWDIGIHLGWIAEKSANGPYVLFLKLITSGNRSSQSVVYHWSLRAGNYNQHIVLEGDTDAPFRAQQGRLFIYEYDRQKPYIHSKIEASAWDNEAKPWRSKVRWEQGRHIQWVAQKSPNGPDTPLVTLILA